MAQRFDRGQVSAVVTEEGFMILQGIATRCGIFEYRQPDGRIIRELRDDADVLDEDSLRTLKLKPVTLGHPEIGGEGVKVTPETWGTFTVGTVTDRVEGKDGLVEVGLTIQRADALRAIERGLRELSCGYECKIDERPGVHPIYGAYDARQHAIRYNHLALVPQGRAGAVARLRLDAAEQLTPEDTMPKLVWGDQEYDVPEELAPLLMGLTEEINRLRGDRDAAGKRMDDAAARMAEIEKMLAEMVQDGEISEEKAADVSEELRSDSMDELTAFNRRLRVVNAAKAMRLDAIDTTRTQELAAKVAGAYLKRDVSKESAAYIAGVVDVVAAQSEQQAYAQAGKALATGRADSASDKKGGREAYLARFRNQTI